MLSKDELKRRLDAARTLRGMTQVELAARLEADGLGKHDLGRIERGEKDMQRVHREAIARHLRIPDYWLTEPDVDVIVGMAPAPLLTPDETRAALARLLADHDRAVDQAPQGTPKQRADEDRPSGVSEGGGA